MLNHDMSEKDEFLVLLRNMEKMMRVNPTMLINSPDYAEKVQRFNSLSSLVSTFNLSEEESKEVQELWNSLKIHIGKRAKKVEEKAKLSPQELLLQTLREILSKWQTASILDKKEMINEATRLQLDRIVISNMTPEQLEEYNSLMESIKGLGTVETVSAEQYSELEDSGRRKFGL